MLPGQPGPAPAAARKPLAAGFPLRPLWNVPGARAPLVASPSLVRTMGLSDRTIVERGDGGGASGPASFLGPQGPSAGAVTPRLTARSGPVGMYHRGQGEDIGGASGTRPLRDLPLEVRNGLAGLHHHGTREDRGQGIWTRPLSAGETYGLHVGSPCGTQWTCRAAPS